MKNVLRFKIKTLFLYHNVSMRIYLSFERSINKNNKVNICQLKCSIKQITSIMDMEFNKERFMVKLGDVAISTAGGLAAWYIINKIHSYVYSSNSEPSERSYNNRQTPSCNRDQYFAPSSDQERSANYTPVPQQLIDFIKNTGYSVTEVCAGNGDNAEELRKNNIIVHAYDLSSISGKVSYGLNGLVENCHDDNILLICSGFDCESSVKNFRGNILIIGGYIQSSESCSSQREFITSLSEPEPFVVDQYAHLYQLHLRPSYSRLLQLGWKFRESFFSSPVKNAWTTSHAFYVFVREYECNAASST